MQNGNSNIIVTLNTDEVETCKFVALRRRNNNRKAGIVELNLGPENSLDVDVAWKREANSLGAEWAFCKAMNLYPEFTCTPRSGGAEIVGRNRVRIDVKQTINKNGNLIATRHKKLGDTDAYVLTIGELPTFELVGWCAARDLIKEANLEDLGYGPTYILSVENLTPITEKYIYPELLDDTRNWKTR